VNRLIPSLLVLLLAGCADMPGFFSAPAETDASAWDLRQEALNKINTWSIKGRLAVQSGKEGWSATMFWDQENQGYRMRFVAPLGQGTYQLQGDNDLVSLLTADNKLYQADTPESLLLDNMGWSVPLHGLKYWIKGIPEPGVSTENLLLDDQGRLTDMQQSGWRISISRYSDFNGTQLPSRLYMHNDRFKLRLVVDDWQTRS
jgi:outer membrane lipoprotein LolB